MKWIFPLGNFIKNGFDLVPRAEPVSGLKKGERSEGLGLRRGLGGLGGTHPGRGWSCCVTIKTGSLGAVRNGSGSRASRLGFSSQRREPAKWKLGSLHGLACDIKSTIPRGSSGLISVTISQYLLAAHPPRTRGNCCDLCPLGLLRELEPSLALLGSG